MSDDVARVAGVSTAPGRMGGEPCITGTRLPTTMIAANRSHAAETWQITPAQVEVACWFEDWLDDVRAEAARQALTEAADAIDADDDVALNHILGGASYTTHWLRERAEREGGE